MNKYTKEKIDWEHRGTCGSHEVAPVPNEEEEIDVAYWFEYARNETAKAYGDCLYRTSEENWGKLKEWLDTASAHFQQNVSELAGFPHPLPDQSKRLAELQNNFLKELERIEGYFISED